MFLEMGLDVCLGGTARDVAEVKAGGRHFGSHDDDMEYTSLVGKNLAWEQDVSVEPRIHGAYTRRGSKDQSQTEEAHGRGERCESMLPAGARRIPGRCESNEVSDMSYLGVKEGYLS